MFRYFLFISFCTTFYNGTECRNFQYWRVSTSEVFFVKPVLDLICRNLHEMNHIIYTTYQFDSAFYYRHKENVAARYERYCTNVCACKSKNVSSYHQYCIYWHWNKWGKTYQIFWCLYGSRNYSDQDCVSIYRMAKLWKKITSLNGVGSRNNALRCMSFYIFTNLWYDWTASKDIHVLADFLRI